MGIARPKQHQNPHKTRQLGKYCNKTHVKHDYLATKNIQTRVKHTQKHKPTHTKMHTNTQNTHKPKHTQKNKNTHKHTRKHTKTYQNTPNTHTQKHAQAHTKTTIERKLTKNLRKTRLMEKRGMKTHYKVEQKQPRLKKKHKKLT